MIIQNIIICKENDLIMDLNLYITKNYIIFIISRPKIIKITNHKKEVMYTQSFISVFELIDIIEPSSPDRVYFNGSGRTKILKILKN